MTKERIKQVILVEGRSDTQKLQQYFDVTTIESNGSALDERTIAAIRLAQAQHGVIVFTDPDISGTKIRQKASQAVPGLQHAFLERDEAKPQGKGSLGVEHADYQALKRALSAVYDLASSDQDDIAELTTANLQALNLVGSADARLRRDYLAKELHLGHVNGKQLAKRLALFGISLRQVAECLDRYEEEKHG